MEKNNELFVLWTNADPITSEQMMMMYTINGMKRGWWDKITVIIWGATSDLVATSPKFQDLIKEGQKAGVFYTACISCARNLGAIEKLEELNIELIPWGVPLTEIIKSGKHLITI